MTWLGFGESSARGQGFLKTRIVSRGHDVTASWSHDLLSHLPLRPSVPLVLWAPGLPGLSPLTFGR